MQIINLIIAFISLALKWISLKEDNKKELTNELETAVSSRDLSKLNGLIDKL